MLLYVNFATAVYKRGKVWWLAYYVNGKLVRESSGTTDRAEARQLLHHRMGELADGRFVGPRAERVTVKDLFEDLLNDYKVNGRKSLSDAERRVKLHLVPFLGDRKTHELTTADVKAYITRRQEEGAENDTINRELAALKRSFNLGLQAAIITRKPHFPMLQEQNVRQGFFERAEFEAILARLPN